jgi:hypothetical protein
VYRKPIGTNRYLCVACHHFPAPKQAVLFTLVHGAKAICDSNRLPQELKLLHQTYPESGHSERQILRALNPPPEAPPQRNEDPDSVAVFPFVGATFNRTSRALSEHNTKTVVLPPRKLSSFLRPNKEDLAMKTPDVCSIPCECGKVYTGQTGRLIETTFKEHHRHIRLYHSEKPVVAERSIIWASGYRQRTMSLWRRNETDGPDLQGGDND